MEMTPDLRDIHHSLTAAIHRDHARGRRRLRLATIGAGAATTAVASVAAAALGGWVQLPGSDWRVSSAAELPAALAGKPVAQLEADDPNLLVCGQGWVGPFARLQSPHDVAAMPGCRPPTSAERAEDAAEIEQGRPELAQPFGYWYRVDPRTLAQEEGRPGAADALGAVYVGSATPLSPAQIARPENWSVMVTGVRTP